MQFYYGDSNTTINITDLVINKCMSNNKIYIPMDDVTRANIFTDPLYGTVKSVFVHNEGTITEIHNNVYAIINLDTNEIQQIPRDEIVNKLHKIHSSLSFIGGSLEDEYPEQMMAATFLKGKEKVLEIGANIGRNSLIIASILENDAAQFVTMECDVNTCESLYQNRDINNLHFNIEPCALSKRNLIQNQKEKVWETIVSDVVLPGYTKVNTITYEQLVNKYNINFDTLVLDCEGAFYYILQDMPEILDNINLIIMENDYTDITHKKYIDTIMVSNGFLCVYTETLPLPHCCNSNFFEVWKK